MTAQEAVTEACAAAVSAQAIPPSPYSEVSRTAAGRDRSGPRTDDAITTKNASDKEGSYFFDSRKRTILGRDAYKWVRLAGFYTVFYFCLGCFFTGLLWMFAATLDRRIPRYYNRDSTMSVRTTASILGMGFRPQPEIDDSLILVTNNPNQQRTIASSLRLYRDEFLLQKGDPRIEDCTPDSSASELLEGTACSFNWFYVVPTADHPCSDNNMYGFKNEEPCILVKLNKIFDWVPPKGRFSPQAQWRLGMNFNKTVSKPDVYITCGGSYPSDADALGEIIYYSVGGEGHRFGTIPNYYFPYRNAPDHVQPFVLAQFKNLPFNRLISVTCRAWVPDIIHDQKIMRGMVTFQLYRTHDHRH